jgi:hypothetical protein
VSSAIRCVAAANVIKRMMNGFMGFSVFTAVTQR